MSRYLNTMNIPPDKGVPPLPFPGETESDLYAVEEAAT